MEYVNNTGSPVRVREIERSENGLEHYLWNTVKEGETVELANAVQAKALGLTLVLAKGVEDEEPTEEEQAANIVKAYKNKLCSIDGIGKKVAEDIISQYPLQEKLIEAIGLGKKIAVRDDVEAALKEEFK